MNRSYRLVWNRALQVLQVASELARPHGGATGSVAGNIINHGTLVFDRSDRACGVAAWRTTPPRSA